MAKILPVHAPEHVEPAHATEPAAAVAPKVASVPLPVAVDPYLARSVKSSPNGF